MQNRLIYEVETKIIFQCSNKHLIMTLDNESDIKPLITELIFFDDNNNRSTSYKNNKPRIIIYDIFPSYSLFFLHLKTFFLVQTFLRNVNGLYTNTTI